MKKLLIFYCFMLFAQISHAQKEANIWYFGNHAGLDFNSGVPVPLMDGQLNTNEGVSAIADADGNLLFYTDGMTVYNKNHVVMVNGTGLMGNDSTSQSAVIVPKPLSDNIYYIFTVTLEGYGDGFRYSEVDISLDGGLGAVTANKNIPLNSPCTEQLTAVKHANGIDIWVITHGYANNAFHSRLVTSDGVSGIPVTSNSGIVFESVPAGTAGCMKVSPQGSKLGICNYIDGAQIFDFDTATGVVSAPVALPDTSDSYGLEFSPSGEVLYITTEILGIVTQYDLTVVDVPASATVVLNAAAPASGGSLQLGPDGKIYKAASSFSYLSVIHNPDIVGAGCNAEVEGVALGGPVSSLGLPNFIQSYFAFGIRVEHLCLGDATAFSIASAVAPEAVSWDFGDGSTSEEPEPMHTYPAAGAYTVSATVTLNGNDEIIQKNITINPLPIADAPDDLYECDENGTGQEMFDLSEHEAIILGGQDPGEYSVTYHDEVADAEGGTDGLPPDYANISNPQIIYARVEHNASGCYAITSFTLNVAARPEIDMPDSYAFCEGSSVLIMAPAGFESYLWSTGATTPSITVDEQGAYTVTVTQDNGAVLCQGTKTVTVTLSEEPVIENIAIADWTNDRNSIKITAIGSGDYEYSLDGVTYQPNPEFINLLPGFYTVFVRDKNGCGMATEEVVLLMYQRFFTPNGDGENETWRIRYGHHEPNLLVHIFDRYGKIITSFRGSQPGWDGTLNGRKLPATDYWFVAIRQDGQEYKGHFSMIR